jgi:HAD superfamily hydrolase (TIGR01509 family)
MSCQHAVVFDLGKVLLDFDYSKVVDRLVQAGRADSARVRHALLESSLLQEYESGLIDSAAFYHRLQSALDLALDFPAFRAGFGDIFSPIPEMIAAQTNLRNRGIPTYILSNTNEIAISHIRERYPFFQQFDGHVLSHEVGSLKPAAPIYQALETRAERTGPNLFYLDDLRENVAAAAARGWQVIHHTSPQTSVALLRDAGFPA